MRSALVSLKDVPDPHIIFRGKFFRDRRDNYAQHVFDTRRIQDLMNAQQEVEERKRAMEKEEEDRKAEYKGIDIEAFRKINDDLCTK